MRLASDGTALRLIYFGLVLTVSVSTGTAVAAVYHHHLVMKGHQRRYCHRVNVNKRYFFESAKLLSVTQMTKLGKIGELVKKAFARSANIHITLTIKIKIMAVLRGNNGKDRVGR